ncbi:hypothetical protein PRUPE_2G138800 [Prunus persica]|uniref:Uncharacterized protein n=1 Tax=Prunus persica TaxID=3760 RepID=A0A251QFI4_PRUPE|nr:hypothetical protein PRUPE_2G138800 [Prunus persica]
MILSIHLIPFLSLFPALFSLSRLSPKRHVHLTTPMTTATIPPSANSALFSSLFALTKKIQNLLTWCLSSVEGNDEAILSWSFYGLANNKLLVHAYGIRSNLVFGVGKVIVASLCGIGFSLCKIRGLAMLVLRVSLVC